jgi:hypothetical protein
MKIVPLAVEECARLGCTHVINLKVTGTGTGDIATVGAILNITAVPAQWVCGRVIVDVRTAFAGMTTPTLDVAFAPTGTGGTNILNGTSLTTSGVTVIAASTAVSTSTNNFLTVRNNGSVASATAGEVNIYLQLADSTTGRNTFAG